MKNDNNNKVLSVIPGFVRYNREKVSTLVLKMYYKIRNKFKS